MLRVGLICLALTGAGAFADSCAAVLTLEQLVSTTPRLHQYIRGALGVYQDARVAVVWGDKPFLFTLSDPPTHVELPAVPRPFADESFFYVRLRVEDHGKASGLDQLYTLRNRFDGEEAVTELEVHVNALEPLDPLSLYIALAAAPFVTRVRLTQNVTDPGAVTYFIRHMAKTADPVVALGPHQAWFARFIGSEGYPLVRRRSRYEPYRVERGHFLPTSVKQARAVRFEYEFTVPTTPF